VVTKPLFCASLCAICGLNGLPVRDVCGNFDVEHIDIGKSLEQYSLAFHHRFAGCGPDVTKAENGRAIGDYGDQVAF